MPNPTDQFLVYFTHALPAVLDAPQGESGSDPNEAEALDLIRSHGHEATFEHALLVAKLGELLRLARKQRDLSQQEAAAQGDLTQAHISRLENGLATSGPTVESLVKYLNGIGFDVELALRFKENGALFARFGSRLASRERSVRRSVLARRKALRAALRHPTIAKDEG